MLALTVTILTAVFILGPDLVSRFILNFQVPRRTISQTRAEEVSRALLTSLVPFTLAFLWVTLRGAVVWSAVKPDVVVYLSGIISQKYLDDNPWVFAHSAKQVCWICWSLAWRLYVIVISYAVLINFLISKYADLRNSKWVSGRPWRRELLATFVLPRISEWHVLLRSFSYTKAANIQADVMTRGDVLYRGPVADLLLSPNGSLSGILLSRPRRFQRERFVEDQKKYAEQKIDATAPNSENYWKDIPGYAFLIMAAEIASINLRSHRPVLDPAFVKKLEEILKTRVSARTS